MNRTDSRSLRDELDLQLDQKLYEWLFIQSSRTIAVSRAVARF
jgi:hypothetical protein